MRKYLYIISGLFIVLFMFGVLGVAFGAGSNLVGTADSWGEDCTVSSGGNKVDSIGCRCNYDRLVDNGSVHIKCNEEKGLVCSDNNSNNSAYNVCLIRIGRRCTGAIDPSAGTDVCETGAVCNPRTGLCEIDRGGEYLDSLGSQPQDIRDVIRKFINIALGFLGVLTVIFIIYGGVLWLTAAGNEDKVQKGKHTLTWAAIGAIVISIAWTITSYVLQVGKTIG